MRKGIYRNSLSKVFTEYYCNDRHVSYGVFASRNSFLGLFTINIGLVYLLIY